MIRADTIAAVATAGGRGAVGIVRLSGGEAAAIAARLCGGLPPPRTAGLRRIVDAQGRDLDEAVVLLFPAPHSFTGEEVVEIQGHGAPVVLEAIVDAACCLGARRARPGEFSERAFLNDRIDLAQAEAIADLVDAASLSAARAARASLSGRFSQQVVAFSDTLMDLRVQVEGALDFSDEDIDWMARGRVHERLQEVRQALQQVRAQAVNGARLAQGLEVVLAGAPNSGKSTLLNAMCGDDVAIVTEVAGTTRDMLQFDLVIDGLPIRLVDTAGLRLTEDVVEREGVRRSRARMASADLVLLLGDDCWEAPFAAAESASELEAPYLHVYTKCDLSGRAPGRMDSDAVRISAATGAGMDALRAMILERAGFSAEEAPFSARARHVEAIDRALSALQRADGALDGDLALDMVAAELAEAQQALAGITGAVDSEDLLGAIFSRFCIGK
ncbi:tRNA uridine-5-carboxymethylaminomethyl(34) synthesis GTPase MnmE [Algiphilus sp.]|uniref:tRNA uridine-5-carboxymethylaminomethyl(34) synthesis GTPase MnmE n=1 Tax=Algiphilus sp. TaxID=1872431 RepID=UPI003B52842A